MRSWVFALFFLLANAGPALYCIDRTIVPFTDMWVYMGNPWACSCPDSPIAGYYADNVVTELQGEYPGQKSFRCICVDSLERFEVNDTACRQQNLASSFNCTENFYIGCADPTGRYATVWLQQAPGNFGKYLTNTIKRAMTGKFNLAQSFHEFGAHAPIITYSEPLAPGNLGIVNYGCYADLSVNSQRILPQAGYSGNRNSIEWCHYHCRNAGWRFFGVEWGVECWCGGTKPDVSLKRPSSECNMPCSGRSGQTCGASGRMNLYSWDTPAASRAPSVLPQNQRLQGTNNKLVSPMGLYTLTWTESPGRLFIQYVNGTKIWEFVDPQGATTTGYNLFMQPDGNLVWYGGGTGRWSTWNGQPGTLGNTTLIRDDGNLVVVKTDGSVVWNSQSYKSPDQIPAVAGAGPNTALFAFNEDEPLLTVSNTARNFLTAMTNCMTKQNKFYMVLLTPAGYWKDVNTSVPVYYRCLNEWRARDFWSYAGNPAAGQIANGEWTVAPSALYTPVKQFNFGYNIAGSSFDCVFNFYTFSSNCGPGTVYPDVDLYVAPWYTTTTVNVLSAKRFDSVTCIGVSICQGSFAISNEQTVSSEWSVATTKEVSATVSASAWFVSASGSYRYSVEATTTQSFSDTTTTTYNLNYYESTGPSQQLTIYFAKALVKTVTTSILMLFPSGTIQFVNPGFGGASDVYAYHPLDYFYPVSNTGIGFPVRMVNSKISSSYTTCKVTDTLNCNFA